MKRFVLAIDVGGTKIAVARVSGSGQITHRAVGPTPPAGGEAVVDAMARLLRQLPAKGALAVSVAVPGMVYPNGAVWAPNIVGWEKMPVAKLLAKRFKLPVVVDSDRNAFVVGEAWKGAAQRCRDVVFVAIGTGIGAGIISGGQLIRGHGELAGCIGWMAVRECYLREYRSQGCLEFHAAGPGIAGEARRVFRRVVTTQEVVKLARAGDPRAMRIFARAGRDLGVALANLVDILSPELIVIGGGMAAAGSLLLSPARQAMRQWAQPLAAKQVKICRSRLGGNAGLLGAAKLAVTRFAS